LTPNLLISRSTWDCYLDVCDQSQGQLLNIEIQFPLNNWSLLWPIDAKLGKWVACIKKQLGIANQVSVIKVKVTGAKN
jgi:hypothetical protein